VTITHSEIKYGFNQWGRFILAIVIVNEDETIDSVHYVRDPFDDEPPFGSASINYKLKYFIERGELKR